MTQKKNQKKWWYEYRPRKKEILKIVFEEDMSFVWKMKILTITLITIAIVLPVVAHVWKGELNNPVILIISFIFIMAGIAAFSAWFLTFHFISEALENEERKEEFEVKLQAFC